MRAPAPTSARGVRLQAWTMIEMLGVLAIMAIVALALVPLLVKQIDQLALKTEQQKLVFLDQNYREVVLRLRQIPNASDYVSLVATEAGWSTDLVLTNARGLRRALIIDPRFRAGPTTNSTLTYAQDISGSRSPVNPRLLWVSSVTEPLPTNVVSGFAATTNDFDALWTRPENAIPSGWTWNGQGEHLLVRRIDLSDLFVQIVLNNQSLNWGRWAVDGSATNSMSGAVFSTYYLRGSVLKLIGHDGLLQSSEVVQDTVSYVYENNVWRGKLFLGLGARTLTGVDLQAAAELFASSPLNANAKSGATPVNTLTTISNYMVAYIAWANAGFPYQQNLIKPFTDSQVTMDTYTVNLIFKP